MRWKWRGAKYPRKTGSAASPDSITTALICGPHLFGLGEDDAIKLGIKDCLSISSWPFSPKIIPIPEPIKRWYHGWLKEHGGYLEPISREGVNRILAKMPFHEYWMRYKALGE